MNAFESDPVPAATEVPTPDVAAESENGLGRIRSAFREFFHGTDTPYRLALVRICLAFTLIFPTAYRWYYSREIFSTDGSGISLWSIYDFPCPWLEPTGTAVVAIDSIVILALVTSCLGWCTRASLVLATVGYTYVNMLDILSSLNKSSAIASQLLLFLCFSQCGAVWSVDSWLARRRLLRQGVSPELLPAPPSDPRWSRRLIQLLMATVYLSAGVTKLQVRGYFTGEHLQTWMLSTIHTPNLLGGYMALHPSLVIVGAYVTAIWELLFMFLVWRSGPRRILLGLGILFHVLTCLTLGLFIFPMICVSAYPAFATDSEIESVRRAAANAWTWLVGRLGAVPALAASAGRIMPTIAPAWSRGAFAAALLGTGVGGVALEYKLDRYGLRRPAGPYQLQELEPQEVSELLAPTQRIEPEDKVLNFDIGSIFVGGSLIDRRTTFYQGETLRVQCGLIPPHENMWIQCNLHDSQNRVVDTIGLFLSCDMLRAHFYYNLGECVMPGEYSLVLKIAGDEIMRRKVTVLPRSTACMAN
jgi:Vitamin K-dependent gamma-carboxylase